MPAYEARGHDARLNAPDEQISLGHLFSILRAYRAAILTSLVAIGILYAVLAIALYLLGPSKQVTSLPFRVVFEGAATGKYPNGMDFNSSEITATPVLQKVYNSADLQRFISFADLKTAVYVVEQNKELDRLALEYNARLADPKLTAVDRDRIEKEYDLKKGSIVRTDYALNFVVDGASAAIPRPMRVEVLRAVLSNWADQAMNEKGAGRYRIPVVSRNILDNSSALDGRDYLVAIDILRTKVNRLISTIDLMLQVPGAEVLTTGKQSITLPEIKANLEDTRRFRLEPLIATVRVHRLSRNYPLALEFLQSQLEAARRKRDQEQARVETMQRSLELFMQRPVTEAAKGATGGAQVIPQVDRSFIDQLSDLISQKRDIDFRQKMVEDLNIVATNRLQPAQSEVAYYESLMQSMKPGETGVPASPEVEKTIQSEYKSALDEAYRAADQITGIYQIMSRNLNPGLAVYTLTDPVAQTSAREFSLGRLLAYGVLLMIIAIPAVLFAVLLHNRIREEEQFDELRHHFTEAQSEITA